ncbi:MAG: selenide, water dikinase SelD [Mangrovicoccus sp.]|nr:selenide, water dikinase SelD [Mangrovicoccus sp.]
MMDSKIPLIRDLVLLGGGHSHALVLRKWGMDPLAGVRLTLINPGPTAPYTGMLPGHIAGHYSRRELEMDLGKLARFAGARLVLGRACGIDRAAKRVKLSNGRCIPYDLLSIDIGITSHMPEIPGFAAHGVAAKPLGDYAAQWEAYLAQVAAGQRPADAAVIGGGIAGVELAFAMHHRLGKLRSEPPTSVHIIETGSPLQGSAAPVQKALLCEMEARGIKLHQGAQVSALHADHLELSDGRLIPAGFCVGAAGARPQSWLAQTGLDLTQGFIATHADLRSSNDPAIFAAGDCAHQITAPRPKAGVFAVRAAPVLFDNLRSVLLGEATRPFRPQRKYLKLISLGGTQALAERGGLSLTQPKLRRALWTWKDRIDRAFMEGFQNLPPMAGPPRPDPMIAGLSEAMDGDKPFCGGCGSKVASGVLQSALADLPSAQRADLIPLPGDDAALLKMGQTSQVITTDHLRAVVQDPWLMARIAACHALGDIWAMGAQPQAALAQVILPRLSRPMQSRWMEEIMGAASGIFAAEGAAIIGGHSSMGAELTLGFTLTGLLDGPPRSLGDGQIGDLLILTRPLGSGVLLAGEMAGQADGRDLAKLYEILATPQGDTAKTLASLAHAMSDVTGFGLLGHAGNIAQASGCGVKIDTGAVPFYPGALALAEAGTRSTLYPDNLADLISRLAGWQDSPRHSLLLDPQTCGGLLASLPRRSLSALDAAGIAYHVIGEITPEPGQITLT